MNGQVNQVDRCRPLVVMVVLLSFVAQTRGDCPLFAYEVTVSMGDSGGDTGYSVAVGADGSVVLAGFFEGCVDFDPSPGIDLHTSNGSGDVFVTRFHSDGTYAWTWAIGQGRLRSTTPAPF